MKATIYENFGCLAAEKRSVYTAYAPHTTATCWNKLTVEISEDKFTCSKNDLEEIIVIPLGGNMAYTLSEMLEGNEYPYLSWFDGYGDKRVMLKILDIQEG